MCQLEKGAGATDTWPLFAGTMLLPSNSAYQNGPRQRTPDCLPGNPDDFLNSKGQSWAVRFDDSEQLLWPLVLRRAWRSVVSPCASRKRHASASGSRALLTNRVRRLSARRKAATFISQGDKQELMMQEVTNPIWQHGTRS